MKKIKLFSVEYKFIAKINEFSKHRINYTRVV